MKSRYNRVLLCTVIVPAAPRLPRVHPAGPRNAKNMDTRSFDDRAAARNAHAAR